MLKKDGKLFGKISVIDILAVIAVVILIVGVAARFSGNQAVTVSSGQEIQCDLRVTEIRQVTVDALKKGGQVYDIDTKEYIGDIVDVKQEDCYSLINMANGERKLVPVEERYDAIVTVAFTGSVSEKGYYTASNRQMSPGGKVGINSKFAHCWSTIQDVYPAEEK